MRKTFRRIAALAVFAAMTVALIPNAFAATNNYMMIDDVKVNDTITMAGKPELNAAFKASSGTYTDVNNTFTITKLAGSVPYFRPKDVDNTTYKVDDFNYGPYLPLTVRLSAYIDGVFEDITTGSLKVDGHVYYFPSTSTSTTLTKADLLQAIMGEALIINGVTVVGQAVDAAQGVWAGDFYTFLGICYQGSPNYSVKTGTLTEGNAENLKTNALVVAGDSQAAIESKIISALLSSPLSRTKNILGSGLLTKADRDLLIDVINEFAAAASKPIGETQGAFLPYAQAGVEYLGTNLKKAAAPSVDNRYYPVTVYHYLYNEMYGPTSHKIEYTSKDGKSVVTRSFTVALGSMTDKMFYAVDATKSLAADAINKDNVYVYASNNNVFIDFSQRDVLANNTFRTGTSYKLWDRSIFNLYGGWVNFAATVLEGDTVFLDAKVLLRNKEGVAIPRGTKLELTFSGKQGNVSEFAYQYNNKFYFTVGDDGYLPFWLALDKADMYWLFNTHNQKYVEVTFKDTATGTTYLGSFMLITRAVDRLTTGTVNVDSGTRITLKVGESKTINASFANNTAMSTETEWATNSAGVASVTKTGAMQATVTGVSVGSAVVTVKGNKDSIVTSIIVDVVSGETPPPSDVVRNYKVVTASSNLNVRSGMGTSFSVIGKLKKGTTFQGIASADGDWVKMTYVNQTGYVSAKYVIVID